MRWNLKWLTKGKLWWSCCCCWEMGLEKQKEKKKLRLKKMEIYIYCCSSHCAGNAHIRVNTEWMLCWWSCTLICILMWRLWWLWVIILKVTNNKNHKIRRKTKEYTVHACIDVHISHKYIIIQLKLVKIN